MGDAGNITTTGPVNNFADVSHNPAHTIIDDKSITTDSSTIYFGNTSSNPADPLLHNNNGNSATEPDMSNISDINHAVEPEIDTSFIFINIAEPATHDNDSKDHRNLESNLDISSTFVNVAESEPDNNNNNSTILNRQSDVTITDLDEPMDSEDSNSSHTFTSLHIEIANDISENQE